MVKYIIFSGHCDWSVPFPGRSGSRCWPNIRLVPLLVPGAWALIRHRGIRPPHSILHAQAAQLMTSGNNDHQGEGYLAFNLLTLWHSNFVVHLSFLLLEICQYIFIVKLPLISPLSLKSTELNLIKLRDEWEDSPYIWFLPPPTHQTSF